MSNQPDNRQDTGWIRTRGAIRVPGGAEQPIREQGGIVTRGALRTRGVLRTRGAPLKTRGASPSVFNVSALLAELRRDINGAREENHSHPEQPGPQGCPGSTPSDVAGESPGLNGPPLSIILHGWPSDSSQAFWAALSGIVHDKDAIWLRGTGSSEDPMALPEHERSLVLDLDQDSDQRVYNNLIGDLVFYPASDPNELESAMAWGQRSEAGQPKVRARAMVIDAKGPRFSLFEKEAKKLGLCLYGWRGNGDEACLELLNT